MAQFPHTTNSTDQFPFRSDFRLPELPSLQNDRSLLNPLTHTCTIPFLSFPSDSSISIRVASSSTFHLTTASAFRLTSSFSSSTFRLNSCSALNLSTFFRDSYPFSSSFRPFFLNHPHYLLWPPLPLSFVCSYGRDNALSDAQPTCCGVPITRGWVKATREQKAGLHQREARCNHAMPRQKTSQRYQLLWTHAVAQEGPMACQSTAASQKARTALFIAMPLFMLLRRAHLVSRKERNRVGSRCTHEQTETPVNNTNDNDNRKRLLTKRRSPKFSIWTGRLPPKATAQKSVPQSFVHEGFTIGTTQYES